MKIVLKALFLLVALTKAVPALSQDSDFQRILRNAESGDAAWQNYIGNMYAEGRGVDQNYQEAVKWYRLAAEQDFAEAQYNLGVMLENGTGVEVNNQEAIKWYRLAAEQGYALVQYNLSVMLENGTLGSVNDQKTRSTVSQQYSIDDLRQSCLEFGFKPDTDALAECVQRENQARIATQATASASNLSVRDEQQEEAIERQRRADINFCKAAMFGRPTRTGDFSESAMLALQCNSNPRAHLSQPAPDYRCSADITGAIVCRAY
jgi:TPR repeat protein